MEEKIVWMWPNATTNFRYLRESAISVPATGNEFNIKTRHRLAGEGTCTIGYSVANGQTVRVWWLYEPTYDGVDPPHDLHKQPYALVDPQSVKLSTTSKQWEPLRVPGKLRGRLDKLPARLERKWADWQAVQRRRERVIVPPGRFARLLTQLRTLFRRKRRV